MRPLRQLPDSRVRAVLLVGLAALAVGSTVLGAPPRDGGPDADPRLVSLETTSIAVDVVDEIGGDLGAPVDRDEPPGIGDAAPTTSTTPARVDGASDGDRFDVVDLAVDGVAGLGEVGVDDVGVDDVGVDGAPVSGVPVVIGDAVEVMSPNDPVCVTPTAVPTVDEASGSTRLPGDDPDTDESAMSSEIPTSNTSTSMDDTPPVEVDEVGAILREAFDGGAPGWTPLSGTWVATDGTYRQTDATGYDFIAQSAVEVPPEYAVSVDLTAIGESRGGGLVIGQPVAGSRRGATLVDFTDGGRFIRWGTYDEGSGQYRYVGGVATGGDFDTTATHRLTVEVRADRTLVVIDDAAVGEFGPVGDGRVGLSTSLSSVSFDDVEIVSL